MSIHDYAELSKIRILLVPIGNIENDVFKKHVNNISLTKKISLQELSQPKKSSTTKFNDFRISGNLYLNFVTKYDKEQKSLETIQPCRRILGVIGIIDCKNNKNISNSCKEFNEKTSEYNTAFAKKIFVFEPEECDILEKDVVLIPTIENISFIIRAMLSDFVSDILAHFEDWSKEIEESVVEIPEMLLIEEKEKGSRDSIKKLNKSDILEEPQGILQPLNARTKDISSDINIKNISLIDTKKKRNTTVIGSLGLGIIESSKKKKLEKLYSKKVIADLYMLAGRMNIAIEIYIEIIETFKNSGDFFWQALATDSYICALFLNKYSTVENETENDDNMEDLDDGIIPEQLKRYIAEMPDQIRELILIYEKSSNKNINSSYLIISLCLRFSKLLYNLHCMKFKGTFINGLSYEQYINKKSAYQAIAQGIGLVNNSSSKLSQSDINSQAYDDETETTVMKSDISCWLMKAYNSGIDSLKINYQILFIRTIINMYGLLGFSRKQAFFIHILGRIVKKDFDRECQESNMVVKPLTFGSLITTKSLNENKLKYIKYRKKNTKKGSNTKNGENLNEFISEYRFPIKNISELLKIACDIYGTGKKERISLLIPSGEESLYFRADEMSIETAVFIFKNYLINGDINRNLRNRTLFGWSKLQINILMETLEIIEIQEDYVSAIEIVGRLLLRYYYDFSKKEQNELCNHFYYLNKKYRLLNKSKFYDLNKIKKAYVDNDISKINNVLYPPSPILIDLNTVQADINGKIYSIEKENKNAESKESSNPFLYTPFSLLKTNENSNYFSINEPIEFTLTFANPFTITIPIQKLSLIITGVNTVTHFISSDIPPLCQYYKIRISVTPTEIGEMKIHGCRVLLFGCIEEVLIPQKMETYIVENDDRDRLNSKHELFSYRKIKYKAKKKEKKKNEWLKKYNIIDEQAYLKVHSTSLGAQSTVEIFEGERAEFSICIQNISKCTIDKLSIGYIKKNNEKVKANQMSPDDLYENEVYYSKQNIIKIKKLITHQKEEITINEHVISEISINKDIKMKEIPVKLGSYEMCKFYFEINGNVKSNEIELIFEYISRLNDDLDNKIYIRQLKVLVNISIQKALIIRDVDFLPAIPGISTINENKDETDIKKENNNKEIDIIKKIKSEINEEDFFTLSLIIFNKWNLNFDIDFYVKKYDEKIDDEYELKYSIHLPSKLEKRILLLIPRKNLPNKILSQKIPGPEGQYIKTKIKTMTPIEEEMIRTRFWYKEELTGGLLIKNGRVKIKWKSAERNGIISLRQMKLTMAMISKLKEPYLKYKTKLIDLNDENDTSDIKNENGDNIFSCSIKKLFGIKFEITNIYDKPYVPCIRIQPYQEINEGEYSINMREKLIWTGSLQKYLPMIQPNMTKSYILPILFLSSGIYKFLYHCEIIDQEYKINNICWANKPIIINSKNVKNIV